MRTSFAVRLEAPHTASLVLACRLRRIGATLELGYTIYNRGSDDAYVLDVMPSLAIGPIHLEWLGGGVVHLVQGVVPAMLPLAQRVAARGRLSRTMPLPLPLVAHADSHIDRDVSELHVTVMALRSTARAFAATPVYNLGDVFDVRSADFANDVEVAMTKIALPHGTRVKT